MFRWLFNFFKKSILTLNNKEHNIGLTVAEQARLINSQIENIYNLISNTNKFYSTLISSIIGVAALLYTNKIMPTAYFNYLYYVVLSVYSISVVWYRTLVMYLHDLNTNTAKYNAFMQKNNIISMYNLSFPINVRKCALQLPFLIGGISLIMLLKYSPYATIFDWILVILYILMFYLSFIYKFNLKLLKYL